VLSGSRSSLRLTPPASARRQLDHQRSQWPPSAQELEQGQGNLRRWGAALCRPTPQSDLCHRRANSHGRLTFKSHR
jgi:hypothetical protein